MPKPPSQPRSNSALGILTIAAGPVYVEFRTQATFAPSSDTHTELIPPDGQWKPQIGGSVWKMALHCQRVRTPHDKFILVSTFAREDGDKKSRSRKHPFDHGDARWLRDSIRKAVGGDIPSNALDVMFTDANNTLIGRCQEYISSKALDVMFIEASGMTDYTFHMEHPIWRPWPVLTIRGGAASELVWQDVVDAWTMARNDPSARYEQTLIFLTGVLRTNLLKTLAEAIRRKDKATIFLLKHAKLVIDFGRTARNVRWKPSPGSQREDIESFREIVRLCVQHAEVVLADEPTAEQFELRISENLPKGQLVIRRGRWNIKPPTQKSQKNAKTASPPPTRPEIWWQYRKASPKSSQATGAQAEFGSFPVSLKQDASSGTLPDGQPAADNRPIRDFLVARSLCLGEKTFDPEDWRRFVPSRRPETAADITLVTSFRKELKELETLVEMEAISTLFLYGETGTGKEVISRWIRDIHPTFSKGKFHAVSCGRQRGSLVQSELFGHVEGAFSDAKERDGAFVTANGGVLLLDDLDALDETTQAMLLRVIEDGLVLPVGGDTERPVHLFLIVTTNVDPKELLERKRRKGRSGTGLREDLYYRFLHTGEVLYLPPLRDRRKDVLPSAEKMWDEQNRKFAQEIPFPDALKTALDQSDLVGNFRTLSAAVAKTFRSALTKKPIPDAETLKLPLLVKRWLEESVEERTGQGPKRTQTSKLLEWLEENCSKSLSELQNQKEPIENRMKEFRGLWKQARKQSGQNGIEPNLRLAQIGRCLACGNKSKLRDILDQFGFRLEVRGRGSTWWLDEVPTALPANPR